MAKRAAPRILLIRRGGQPKQLGRGAKGGKNLFFGMHDVGVPSPHVFLTIVTRPKFNMGIAAAHSLTIRSLVCFPSNSERRLVISSILLVPSGGRGTP